MSETLIRPAEGGAASDYWRQGDERKERSGSPGGHGGQQERGHC